MCIVEKGYTMFDITTITSIEDGWELKIPDNRNYDYNTRYLIYKNSIQVGYVDTHERVYAVCLIKGTPEEDKVISAGKSLIKDYKLKRELELIIFKQDCKTREDMRRGEILSVINCDI
jgi:hypothetical protein